jgi:hypothetical protein
VAVVQGLVAETHVDVELGIGVAREPARLNADGTTANRPLGAIRRCGHATAYSPDVSQAVICTMIIQILGTVRIEQDWYLGLCGERECTIDVHGYIHCIP